MKSRGNLDAPFQLFKIFSYYSYSIFHNLYGGKSRIRTHGSRKRSSVFKTDAIDHSAIFPLFSGSCSTCINEAMVSLVFHCQPLMSLILDYKCQRYWSREKIKVVLCHLYVFFYVLVHIQCKMQ